MTKEMLSFRVPSDTKERIENYAEKHDVSQSVAIRRLLEKGADLEESGLMVAASKKNNGDENTPIADGGMVTDRLDEFEKQMQQYEEQRQLSTYIFAGLLTIFAFYLAVEFTIGLPSEVVWITAPAPLVAFLYTFGLERGWF